MASKQAGASKMDPQKEAWELRPVTASWRASLSQSCLAGGFLTFGSQSLNVGVRILGADPCLYLGCYPQKLVEDHQLPGLNLDTGKGL